VDELVSLVAKYNLDIIEKVVERLDEIVRNHVSGRDCVSRCGLDQFAILTDDRALKLAKKILRDIGARRFVVDDLIFSLTVSAAALPIPEATGVSRASSIKLFGSATQAAFLATRAKPGEIVRLDRFQP
jgi:GGDEF domain-containing protein